MSEAISSNASFVVREPFEGGACSVGRERLDVLERIFGSTKAAPVFALLAFLLLFPSASEAQSPLVGTWATHDGETIEVLPCGRSFCATVSSGPLSGASVARVSGEMPEFSGHVQDPRSGQSYPGSLTVEGDRIALKGCIMKVFCKTVQHWRRAD